MEIGVRVAVADCSNRYATKSIKGYLGKYKTWVKCTSVEDINILIRKISALYEFTSDVADLDIDLYSNGNKLCMSCEDVFLGECKSLGSFCRMFDEIARELGVFNKFELIKCQGSELCLAIAWIGFLRDNYLGNGKDFTFALKRKGQLSCKLFNNSRELKGLDDFTLKINFKICDKIEEVVEKVIEKQEENLGCTENAYKGYKVLNLIYNDKLKQVSARVRDFQGNEQVVEKSMYSCTFGASILENAILSSKGTLIPKRGYKIQKEFELLGI